MAEKKMENKIGARTHPCFVPFVTEKGSERRPPHKLVLPCHHAVNV
jgi:hypothetical protein